VPNTTVGTTGAEKTGTESAAEKNATPDTGANGSAKNAGIDARFAELTGEIARKDALIEKMRTEKAALEEKHKTDEEKRIEQIATERFKPDLERKMALETYLSSERDALLKQIPDEHKGLVLTGDHIPVEQQITQARSVLSLIHGKTQIAPFSGGGNPPSEQKRTYSQAEYVKWSQASTKEPEYYMKHRDEMQAAIRDGRVEGLR
jgi:hypothetical protein